MDGTEAQRGQTGQMGTSSLVFLSFLLSSFVLIILFLFRSPLFQWSTTTGGQDGTNGNTGQDGGADRHDRCVFGYCFFLLSSLLLLAFTISFVTNYSNRLGEAEGDGTGWAATSIRDGTGGRRMGGGGRRREEGGLAGNMGTAEAEGQVKKGCEWELRGADSGGRRGRWTGEQVRTEAGQHDCCPTFALAIWSRHGQFPP